MSFVLAKDKPLPQRYAPRIANLQGCRTSFAYPDLPILARKDDILKAVRENQALVVQGGTGSGKTTQLPKFLLESGLGDPDADGVRAPAGPHRRDPAAPHRGPVHRRSPARRDRPAGTDRRQDPLPRGRARRGAA